MNDPQAVIDPPDTRRLQGWGRASTSECRVWRPTDVTALTRLVDRNPDGGLIARGCGRSYGDAAANHGGAVVDTSALDRIESFDPTDGRLVCGAGVTLGHLVQTFLPRGFVPPVCPGTGFVTVGGAIANDVHGKNHARVGSFAAHVDWFDLITPDGRSVRVDPDREAELFNATTGGAGMTGVIHRAGLRLQAVPGPWLSVTETRQADLETFMASLLDPSTPWDQRVGWIDALARGRSLGRGILGLARHCEDASERPPPRPRRPLTVPFDAPAWLLNRLTVSAFNAAYIRRFGRQRTMLQPFDRFVFPLDAILQWNRLYGRPGVLQFQCVVPFESAQAALTLLLGRIRTAVASPLAVLKTLGASSGGMLSFPRPGFTLAVDFPHRPETRALMRELHAITIDHGGRVYLAKDACLQPGELQRMYPRYEAWLALIRRLDPERRMRSDLSRRVGMHEDTTGE